MTTFLGYAIVGLNIAAIYAISSTGLVLTYTTTGLFNFGHGALGMLAAFAYWQVNIEWGWPAWLAIPIVVGALAPALGALLEILTRGLIDTNETTKLVVSVSLLFGMIGIAQAVWDPTVGRRVPQFFEGHVVDLGITRVSYHQITTMVTAVVAVGLLWVLLRRTRLGVSMRAAVDDRRLAVLTGIRTDRVQRVGWMVGSMMAATSGVLVASTAGLNANVLALLIINAYACAVFGRLRSLPMTVVGALVVGLADSLLNGYLPQNPYRTGFRLATPVIVLFVAVLIFPDRRVRPYVRSREHFPSPTHRGVLVACSAIVAFGIALASMLDAGDVITYGRIFPVGMIALSLVVLTGFANQVSLCQLSFAGIGATVVAQVGAGANPAGLVAAAVAAAAAGALVALPVVRLSGIYLALATASFAVAMDRWIFGLATFHIGSWEVQSVGATNLPVDRLDFLGWRVTSERTQVVVAAVVLALLTAGVGWLRISAFGRRLVALREGDTALATCGVNVVTTRVAVFALSAGIAGLGGAFYAQHEGLARAQPFEFITGLPIFMSVAILGAGYIGAGILTGVFVHGMLPMAAALAPWFERWSGFTTGSVALVLGEDPSGVSSSAARRLSKMRPTRGWVGVLLLALGSLAVARLVGLVSNWAFVAALASVVVVALRTVPRSVAAGSPAQAGAAPRLEVAGGTEPWSEDTLALLDIERLH